MALPSSKILLKRSRSSADPAADQEEILKEFTVAYWAGRGTQKASTVSQVVQTVTDYSQASKLFCSSDNVRAVALARSPTYPFDSSTALIRWLLAGRTEGEAHSECAQLRKHAAYHGTDATKRNENAIKASLPSSASLPFATDCEASPQDGSVTQPKPGERRIERKLAGTPNRENHSVDRTGVASGDTSASQDLAKVVGASRALVNNSTQVLTKTIHLKDIYTATPPAATRRNGHGARHRCPQFGLLCLCGRRREMEDTCTVEPDLVLLPCDASEGCHCNNRELFACSSFHFFGVYDGHGGTHASSFCKARLHKALTEELIKDVRCSKKAVSGPQSDWPSRWRRVMEACFLKVDKEVGGVCPTGGCSSLEGSHTCCVKHIAPDNVGTTAVVAVIGPCQIIVANCGDSRAVLSRGGNVVPLSRDHKPERDDEMNRIVAAGGRIICWNGYRVGGLLTMSRAIGDRFLKDYVIAVPEVTCVERTKEDECLILASDGLWDVVSSEMACDIARRRLRSQRRKCANSDNPSAEETPAGAAAALLAKLALSRGSKDNITVIVIDLKSRCRRPL